jgi:hemerythrin-like domain-containing protein
MIKRCVQALTLPLLTYQLVNENNFKMKNRVYYETMSEESLRSSVSSDGQPIKRIEPLIPLSREHHHGLLLCWKIKKGISKGISLERIKAYTDWFYQNHLLPHFEVEEKYVFPILGTENEFVQHAIDDHRRLSILFSGVEDIKDSLEGIQTELQKHIRFEERILFNEIQNAATEDQLRIVSQVHQEEKFIDNLTDVFWE